MESKFKGKRGEHKNHRAKARNLTRKRENLAKMEAAQAKRLSPTDQLARLDFRLGKGVGAVKERARLLTKLNG